MARKNNGNSRWKVIATDVLGVLCLVLVPFIGWLPGPGGIPLLIAGFGLLAVNHDWADDAVNYVKNHSESLRGIVFPDKKWIKLAWDILVVILLIGGTTLNFSANNVIVKGLSIGIMAGSTTIFMFNRDRISWLDKQLRRTGKK
jgi:hypothetical protein